MDHPVEADVGCRNTVFHAAAQSAAGVVPLLRRSGVRRFRIELVRETRRGRGAHRRRVPRAARGGEGARDVLANAAGEGGYGVVAGSLRVLDR